MPRREIHSLKRRAKLAQRVMIVGGEEAALMSLSEYFTARGWAVDCAREREEAEALLSHVEYAAVIADLWIRKNFSAEGLQIVSHVRSQCPGTRVILTTADSSPELKAEALRRGADAFLLTPQTLSQVGDLVFTLLEGRDETSQPARQDP
ncbi:MAG: response regulator [Pyrinomonadaceae bacterium]